MITRRNLLQGLCATTALVAVGGISIASAGEAPLRPPGAEDETRFIGSCIRCDRCRSACPTKAIGVATLEDGLINMRTPKMEFRLGYCDECGGSPKCYEVCPVDSFLPLDGGHRKIGLAAIDTSVCLTYGISGRCPANCIPACPEGALSIDEGGHLVLKEELCWGCGACEYHCVSDSYGSFEKTGSRGINIVKAGA